jgi:hypothetical protein
MKIRPAAAENIDPHLSGGNGILGQNPSVSSANPTDSRSNKGNLRMLANATLRNFTVPNAGAPGGEETGRSSNNIQMTE